MQDEFFAVCTEATIPHANYVSLYERTPFYGGPEEGGWWSASTQLVAYKSFISSEEAEAALAAVKALASRKTDESRKAWGDRCLKELEWMEARGLDPDFLPETDGNDEFFAVCEERPGSEESEGTTHYE